MKVIKWAIIINLLLLAYLAYMPVTEGSDPVYIEYNQDQRGYSLIRIVNTTGYNINCEIVGYNYYESFPVRPGGSGDWYYEPNGKWTWRCK